MSMAHETATLATYVAGLGIDDLPDEVVARARLLVLDLCGSIVRGGAEADSTPTIRATLAALGLGVEGPATVPGDARGYAPPVAALLGGMFGHSLDFDDTHADSSLHPSAPVVPAAFAAGEMVGATGAQVLAAIVAGYEVCCRLGLALDPTRHYARGFHPTATAGVFGAAAAAARLFGLDAERTEAAFGVAGSQAAGSLQFLVNGAWNKRYQVGAAAMNGVIAASLARHGFKGAAQPIEGRHGLLHGYTDGADATKAVAGLGTVYETLRIGLKPFPSCRYTHAALRGLLDLRREMALTADAVEHVRIGLHRNGITLTAEPLEAKRRPANVVDGQFSMPFTAAVALHRGAFGWDDYADLSDPGLAAIADRVDVVRDERLEGRAHPFGAVVSLRTRSGVVERAIDDPPGEPATFPSAAEVMAKFLALAEPVSGPAAARFAEALARLEDAAEIGAVLRLLRPGSALDASRYAI
jgi:2-methylcitrate dehydratase PrpD